MGKRCREVHNIITTEKESTHEESPPSKKPRKETNALSKRTLFIRSLPVTATNDDFTTFFSQKYPLKHATIVLDPETKKSKGYGFVTFADSEDAQKAYEDLNGTQFLGRRLKIEIAEPRSRQKVNENRSEINGTNKISPTMTLAEENKLSKMKVPPKLIIRNLPWSVKSSEQLAKLFEKFGKIKFSTLPNIREGTQAGFGFITFRKRKSAERAMEFLNNTTVDGRTVSVDWAVDKGVWENRNQGNTEKLGSNKLDGKLNVNAIEDESQMQVQPNNGMTETSAEQEEDDVSNFFKNFGHQLESEDEGEEITKSGSCEDEDMDSQEPMIGDLRTQKTFITDNSTTLFIRNLPFNVLDETLKEKFEEFGPIRYARVVMDRNTGRPKGTGFVCFYRVEDADSCYHGAPRVQLSAANAVKVKHSVLEDETADTSGMYTMDGRVLQISRAIDRENAVRLSEIGTKLRANQDKDKRKLYLLQEGTIAAGTPLYDALSSSEIKMREDSAIQRKRLTQNNPALHLSLTRLSVRNLPRHLTSKDLKALARQAVVGFAQDVKSGLRAQLSKEEESRGGDEDRIAEKTRRSKGKGIVRQAKVVFESHGGNKVAEDSGAGRSRGYAFVEYYSHRWALMGLRWMNGHAIENASGKTQRLIVEFAIENAQVVQRRKMSEEKARLRSQEVLNAREKGEAPKKERKYLKKDQVMAKMRRKEKDQGGKQISQVKSRGKVLVKKRKPSSVGHTGKRA